MAEQQQGQEQHDQQGLGEQIEERNRSSDPQTPTSEKDGSHSNHAGQSGQKLSEGAESLDTHDEEGAPNR